MTVTTVFPDAHPESNSVDGDTRQNGASELDWTTLVNSTGDQGRDTLTTNSLGFTEHANTDKWAQMRRVILLFNDPVISVDNDISAATLSVYGSAKGNNAGSMTQNVYVSAPASDTAIVSGDFNSFGTTAQSDSGISHASFSILGFNDWVLNSTGLGNVNKNAISKFGLRDSAFDVPDSAPTWQGSSVDASATHWSAEEDQSGDRRPKLAITHTLPESIFFASVIQSSMSLSQPLNLPTGMRPI